MVSDVENRHIEQSMEAAMRQKGKETAAEREKACIAVFFSQQYTSFNLLFYGYT